MIMSASGMFLNISSNFKLSDNVTGKSNAALIGDYGVKQKNVRQKRFFS